ncbi:MAG: recombinase family protein [Pseudomonadota bacterium]|nr:recombinase family protein [Pseudomonadota bacterium]
MTTEHAPKVTAAHLRREAYLYVRQSTLRQVLENTESTERQYGLRNRALGLGWPLERIRVIDSDLGKSGAERDRSGFQQLVAEVGMGRAGIVMSLEVSRLARNCTDWHRLLEICALTDTLILDEDGLYDPGHFNDRLLLGLKGTMSAAELHLLHARLQGGIRNKARRGELAMRLPIGLVYSDDGRVLLDPDRQVQGALRLLFETFERTGSAAATVKAFRKQGLTFPRRRHLPGPGQGEVIWAELEHSQVLRVLHNPRYAGAFSFGKTRTRRGPEGETLCQRLAREQWQVLLPRHHVGYIAWETFEANQQRLRDNAAARGTDRRHGPPREGPALLQGLVLCGRCGRRMTVRYKTLGGGLAPHYVCQAEGIRQAQPICQSLPGAAIDTAVGQRLLETLTPLALEVTLAVEQEVQARLDEADALRGQQVERARYEAELARRRYLQVDPDHRLVAAALEAEWNEKLRALQAAQETYERHRQTDRHGLDDAQRARIRALAEDFPRLWQDPHTPARERKRLVRLLIEDVTLRKDRQYSVHLRFKTGRTQTLSLPLAKNGWQRHQTDPALIAQIDCLLEDYTEAQVAERLNAQGHRCGMGGAFHVRSVARLRKAYSLKSRYQRLRERGLLTQQEIAERLGVHPVTVQHWRHQGRLVAYAYSDKPEYLYENPGECPPLKYQWQRRRQHLGSASATASASSAPEASLSVPTHLPSNVR